MSQIASTATASRSCLLSISVGKKYLMAVTGLGLTGFVLTHMLANLLILFSADAYNAYSHALTSNKAFLLTAEAGLVTLFLLHIFLAISLTRANRAARPDRYAMGPTGEKAATLASRTMIHHGMVIFIFVILHLKLFKYGAYYETNVHGVAMRDLYRLVLEEFKEPGEVIWYVAAMCVLGFHLSHGIGSTFQSLGWNHPRYTPKVMAAGLALAILIAAGFILPPLYVFFIL